MSEQNQNSKNNKSTTSSSTNSTNTPEAQKLSGAQAVQTSGWRKLLAKKWVFPTVYIAAAAIILTLVWVYQGTQLDKQTSTTAHETVSESTTDVTKETQEQAEEMVANNESLGWPVEDAQAINVVKGFYDEKASEEERIAATVKYNQTFSPNTGIDIAREDKQGFDVLAAMMGTVTRAEQHPIMGSVVEIEHPNGMKTVYQSVADVTVKKGDAVKKGEKIATAGRSEMEKDLDVHVHFELYENNQLVNPTSYLSKN